MIRRTGEAAATCTLARTQGAGRARKMRGFALTMHSSNSELAVLFMLLPKTSSLQAEAAKSEESVTAVQQVEELQRSEEQLWRTLSSYVRQRRLRGESALKLLVQRASMAAEAPADGRRHEGKHKHVSMADALFAEGKAANAAGDAELARGFFESAFVCQPRLAFLLSMGNMHLKLDETEHAEAIYRHVEESASASDKEKEMARRKLAEAKARTESVAAMVETCAVADADVHTLMSVCQRLVEALAAGPSEPRSVSAALAAADLSERDKLLQEVELARALASAAVAQKTVLETELAHEHKAHRRAKASQMALQQVATALEVKVAVQAAADAAQPAGKA
uniref:Uncharacterized protein n=1 Tax=Chrysotila carterae TaxID=13221 RepID=A0A7S4F7S4_CHRCT